MVSTSTFVIFIIVFAILGLMLGIAESSSVFLRGHSAEPYIDEADPFPHLLAPPSPDEIGCHSYTPETGWIPADCLPEVELIEGPFDLDPGQL